MKNKSMVVVLVMSIVLISGFSRAEDMVSSSAPKAGTKPAKPEVLDFEGDVIEGQKKTLDLFLQLDVEKADLSTVLYDRANFNEFHKVDSVRRPKFSAPKKAGK